MRWNLYLIIIIDNKELIDNYLIQQIEQDEDYARKYVLTEEETVELLNRDWLKNIDDKQTQEVNPLHEWIETLAKANLTGCLGTFYRKNVENYLNGEPFDDSKYLENDEIKISSGSKGVPIPSRIKNIVLHNFRNHCFEKDETIHPELINLFIGSNGSGKTSIMEAIEYSMTEGIQRLDKLNAEYDQTLDVEVNCLDLNRKKCNFGPGKWNLKELEEAWYGIPAGRSKQTLNYNFCKFNYFDADAAYRFALEESNNRNEDSYDYTSGLSRLVFGESIVKNQKWWLRYLEEFNKRNNNIQKEIGNLKKEVSKNVDKKKKIEDEDNFNLDELINLLNNLNLNKEKLTMDKFDSNVEWLSAVADTLNSLESSFDCIRDFIIEDDVLIIDFLEKQIIEYNKQIETVDNEKDNILKGKEEIDRLNQDIEENVKKKNNNIKDLKNIKDVSDKWNDILDIIIHEEKVNEKEELSEKLKKLQEHKEVLERAIYKWNNIKDLDVSDISSKNTKKIDTMKKNYRSNKELKEKIDVQIKSLNSHYDKLKSLQMEIKSLGERYLDISEDNSCCPLCGHDYNTTQHLSSAINKALEDVNDNKILELKNKQLELNEKIKEIKEVLEAEKQKKKKYNELMNLIDYLNDTNHYNIDTDIDDSNLLDKAKSILSNKEELENEIKNINNLIKNLNENGFTRERIEETEYFKNNNDYYLKYKKKNNNNNEADERFSQYLLKKELDLEEKIKCLENKISEKKAKLKEDKKKYNTRINKSVA